jgi:hypothetical protein
MLGITRRDGDVMDQAIAFSAVGCAGPAQCGECAGRDVRPLRDSYSTQHCLDSGRRAVAVGANANCGNGSA